MVNLNKSGLTAQIVFSLVFGMIRSLPTQDREAVSVKVLCEGSVMSLTCDVQGHVLNIKKALFGRLNHAVCRTSAESVRNTMCGLEDDSATQIVAHTCDGHHSCQIHASTTVFDDHCPGTDKYLELQYECSPHVITTTRPGFGYEECKDSERDSHCLDEGACLATEGREGIKNCRCTEGWMGARCQDRTTSTTAATTTTTPEGYWSLTCPQTLYVGALNRSVTLQCRVTGVDLHENEIFGRVIWTKGPHNYDHNVLEVLMRPHKPLLTKSGSYFKGRASLKPAPFFSSSNTDISLTISNIQPKDFDDYKVEVVYATEGKNFRQPKKLFPITLKEQHEINICDFNGAEIDFPQSSEVQSILLTYAWHSSSDCEAFLGMAHDMHFTLEVVSFHPFHPALHCEWVGQAHPMLQMLQMQDVINLTNTNENGHTLRVFDLCAVFVALYGRRMPLPHTFHINGEADFKNILGLKLAGRHGAPGFELRLTRIPAPVKAAITVPIKSPARLQCWGACPFENANLLYVDESGTRQDLSHRLRTERIRAGKSYSVFQGIKIEGEAKGFRRSCSGSHAATVAKFYKFDVKDADLKAGTYTVKYDDQHYCTFVMKAGGK